MKKLKSQKSEVILNTLSPLDPKVQRYLSLSEEVERVMDNAENENEACVPVELIAEFFMLQEKLYKLSLDKLQNESN